MAPQPGTESAARERTTVSSASATAIAAAGPEGAVYDVVLLAGSPLRYTIRLAADLAEGSVIEIDGTNWAVADVRTIDGAPQQLICIYDV